jgi:type I restriction enzyme S subunit
MSEWKEVKLGEIADVQTGPFGSQLHASDYVSEGIPCVMPTNIGNRLDFRKEDIAYIKESDARRLSKHLLKKGDIVYSRRGDVEKCGYVKSNEEGWFCGTGCLRLRINDEKANSLFVAFFLSAPEIKSFISNNAVGTTMPNLNSQILNNVPLLLPDIKKQQSIASILSSLDDKIDLLHRQNATLEKMAETLFRQWFVVEEKEEWKIGKISDYALHYKDSVQPQKNQSTLYFHYSIPSFDNGRNPINELGAAIQSNKYKVPANCVLFSKLNPHKDKRVWLLQNNVKENAICSTEFQVVFPKNIRYLYFLYGWLTLNENYNEIASGVGGTSGSHQRIDPKAIYEFQCPLISDSEIENYNVKIEPIFKKQVANQTQIRTLTSLRDTLLPKLMSGEVRVSEL